MCALAEAAGFDLDAYGPHATSAAAGKPASSEEQTFTPREPAAPPSWTPFRRPGGDLAVVSTPVQSTAIRRYQWLAMMVGMAKQTNIRLNDDVRAAAEDRAARRGLSLQGYVADLIEADVNQSRAAFMVGAAAFLAGYADTFEAEVGEDRYPGLPDGLEQTSPKDAA